MICEADLSTRNKIWRLSRFCSFLQVTQTHSTHIATFKNFVCKSHTVLWRCEFPSKRSETHTLTLRNVICERTANKGSRLRVNRHKQTAWWSTRKVLPDPGVASPGKVRVSHWDFPPWVGPHFTLITGYYPHWYTRDTRSLHGRHLPPEVRL